MLKTQRHEKEKHVIELHEQGKTYREIAKEVHISLGDISSIIKKSSGEVDDEEIKKVSKDTQARILFDNHKTPLEVSNELDLTVGEVERIYTDFWKLKGYYDLYSAYEREIKNNIPSFLKLYRIVKEKGIGEKVVLKILENLDKVAIS